MRACVYVCMCVGDIAYHNFAVKAVVLLLIQSRGLIQIGVGNCFKDKYAERI
jgi:hypothetical protein